MSSKEDYLDSLLKTVSAEEPSSGTALHKLAEIQEEEKNTAMAENLAAMVDNLDDGGDSRNQSLIAKPSAEAVTKSETKSAQVSEDEDELEEEDLDFPELERLFREDDKKKDADGIKADDVGKEPVSDVPEMLEEVSLSDSTALSDIVSDDALDELDAVFHEKKSEKDEQTEEADVPDEAELNVSDEIEADGSDEAESDVPDEIEPDGSDETEADVPDETEGEGAEENSHLSLSDMDIADLEALMQDDLFDDKETEEEIPVERNDGEEDTVQENMIPEDADVTALIDAMNGGGDLAEIGELLKKSDNNEMIDDDMQDLVDSLSGESADTLQQTDQSADETSVQEAAAGAGAEEEDIEDLAASILGKKASKGKKSAKAKKEKKKKEPSEKKQGFFKKLLAFLTDDEEDADISDELGQIDLSKENIEILENLDNASPKPGKKPKQKKEKKPKVKKEKKPKPKKEKKPKQKKEKKPKPPKEPEKPLKPIGKRKIIVTVFFAFTILGMILLFTTYIPDFAERREGRKAFEEGNYKAVYELLVTKKVKGTEEKMLKGATLCLQMERKLESYENYKKIGGMELEQLNALITGVDKYHKIEPQAQQYGVLGQVKNTYLEILNILQSEYGVSEQQAQQLLSLTDSVAYTKELKQILGIESDFAEEIAAEEE